MKGHVFCFKIHFKPTAAGIQGCINSQNAVTIIYHAGVCDINFFVKLCLESVIKSQKELKLCDLMPFCDLSGDSTG